MRLEKKQYREALFDPTIYLLVGELDEYTAAAILTDKFLGAQFEPHSYRTFIFTEMRGLEIEVIPSLAVTEEGELPTEYGVEPNSEFVGEDIWLVYPDVEFKFEGIYGAIGYPIPEMEWYTSLHQGSDVPLILTKTDTGYAMKTSAPWGTY